MKHVALTITVGDHHSTCNHGRGKHQAGLGEHFITASEMPIILDALRNFRGQTVRDEVLDDLIDKLDII
jgi:hypothetical protein